MNPHLLSKSEVRVLRSSSELSNGLRRVVAGAVPFSMSRARTAESTTSLTGCCYAARANRAKSNTLTLTGLRRLNKQNGWMAKN